jgi:hypothetical protein
MSRVRFKPTISLFEWAKTIHALGRSATVSCSFLYYRNKLRSLASVNSELILKVLFYTLSVGLPKQAMCRSPMQEHKQNKRRHQCLESKQKKNP